MPYRKQENQRIAVFRNFMQAIGIDIIAIDEVAADRAARIRAEYKGFKAMDALQLAAACISGSDLFLTNDKQLRQFKDIQVVTVDELV